MYLSTKVQIIVLSVCILQLLNYSGLDTGLLIHLYDLANMFSILPPCDAPLQLN